MRPPSSGTKAGDQVIALGRDDSYPINPFLQSVLPLAQNTVYWRPSGRLDWFDAAGASTSVWLAAPQVRQWFLNHDPAELLAPWSRSRVGEEYLVEHTSVNPVHPLHAGSLRGTVVGNSLAELLRGAGAQVQVRYFVNDLGRQVWFLRAIATEVDWSQLPSGLRFDEAVGVLYALANMIHAGRDPDIARLTGSHPWLTRAVAHLTALPAQPPPHHRLLDLMVEHALADLRTIGAHIDRVDRESALGDNLLGLALELAQRGDPVTVNGTLCLRRPGGLIPMARRDRSVLYFIRDAANTLRRVRPGLRILHVIGDDQRLAQAALADALPHVDCEHVPIGMVSDADRTFSARQNRLLTFHDLHERHGPTGVWRLALAMLCRHRGTPIDLARLDEQRPLRIVLHAHRIARTSTTTSPPHSTVLQDGDPAWWGLVTTLLRTPDTLHRATTGREPHYSASLLVEMSVRYVAATRRGRLPGWITEWFIATHTRLAEVHGLDLIALVDSGAGFDEAVRPHRRRSA